MTDKDKHQIAIFTGRKPLWWLRFFRWPGLLREVAADLDSERRQSERYVEAFRSEQGRVGLLETLGQEARNETRDALEKLREEQKQCLDLRSENNAIRNDMAQTLEVVRDLQNKLQSEKLESERLRMEVSKTMAQLERAELHLQSQKAKFDEQQKILTATYKWIRESQRLDVPIRTPVRQMLAGMVKKATAVLLLLLPAVAMAQFPPPFFRNAWSTNVPPDPVFGNNNLSITNLNSGTNWQFFNVGPFTIARLSDTTNVVVAATNSAVVTNWINFRQPASAVLSNLVGTVANNVTNVVSLSTSNATSKPLSNSYANGTLTLFGLEQGANITLTPNASNIVIASTGAGGALTTNANQFGPSVELTLKSGAFQTNLNFFGEGTNHQNLFVEGDITGRNILPEIDNAFDIGSASMAHNAIFSKAFAVVEELGNNFVTIATPVTIAADYFLTLPSAQGGNGQIITNDGTGALGWFNPDALLVGLSNYVHTKQHGTDILTNWSRIQAVTIVSNNANISNLLINATSGTKFVFGSITQQVRGVVGGSLATLAFPDFKLTNVNNIWLKGNGNTVFHGTNMDGMLFGIQQCSNILISGITFRGTKTNSTAYQVGGGIQPYGLVQAWGTNSRVLFVNCTFEHVNMFGLLSGADGGGVEILTHDLAVLDSLFYRCGHTNFVGGPNNPDGGALDAHPDLYMDNCQIVECGRGVECFATTGVEDYFFTVRNTKFRDNWSAGVNLVSRAQTIRAVIDNCLFTVDNTKRKNDYHIRLLTMSSAVVQNCVWTNIAGSGDYCIDAGAAAYGNSANIQIGPGNVFSHVDHAVGFVNQYGGSIIDNIFEYCTNGVLQLASDGTRVSGNLFYQCGIGSAAGYPVLLRPGLDGTNTLITENRFVRKAGVAPPGFVFVASTHRDTKLIDNYYQDVPGGVVKLKDSGVNTQVRDYDTALNSALTLRSTNFNAYQKLTYAVDWQPTNTFILSVTNPQAGQILKFNTVTYSGNGDAQIVVTNAPDDSGASGFTTNANQFGPSVQLTIKDGALLTNITHLGTLTVDGGQTNSGSLNVAGGVTNWTQTEVKGTLFASSNLIAKAGESTTNFWPEGPFGRDTSHHTNLNGTVTTFTNLAATTIPAHMLTNLNDTVYAYWEGVTGTALQTTNNFQIVYGSATLLDTGLQFSSNIIFRAWATITRVGNTEQQVNTKFEWVPNALGTTGVPWATTNENFRVAQTNGINTGLALRAASRRPGGVTNTFAEFKYSPGPR